MNVRRLLIAAAVTGLGVTVAYVGWHAVRPTVASYAAETLVQNAHFGGRGNHHGWRHGGRGHAMICSDRRDKRLNNVIALVEGFVDFTPAQTQQWNELTTAARAGSTSIGTTCEELAKAPAPKTAPERLARVETMVTTGLGLIRQIRPAFDGFYASLSDTQKKALDDMISRHRHGPKEPKN